LLAFAAAVMAFKASAVKRTGTIRPFASPFGSLGRPTLALFGNAKLLYDCGSDCGSRGIHWRNVQHSDMAFFLAFRIVRPCVNALCSWVILQIENLHDSFPYRAALKDFFDSHALNVLCLDSVQPSNHVPKLF
jgi:hypothetical protein